MSDMELLKRKLDRERRARKQAESLIEQKSRELYEANQELERFNAKLEQRVEAATVDIRASNAMLEHRVRELAALNQVADAMNSVIELERLLETIMDVAKDVMNAEAGSLLLLKKDSGDLEFQVAIGPSGETLRNLTVDVGRGIAGHVAQSGQAVCIHDAYSDPQFDASFDEQSGFRTRSLLAAPIEVKDEIIGVVEVINKVGHDSFDGRMARGRQFDLSHDGVLGALVLCVDLESLIAPVGSCDGDSDSPGDRHVSRHDDVRLHYARCEPGIRKPVIDEFAV